MDFRGSLSRHNRVVTTKAQLLDALKELRTLMTLEEGGGEELRRFTRPVAADPVRQPSLLRMRNLRDRYLTRQCA